jgi:prepilin-type N-terminal cleavage/methylation domain-containing protein
MQHGFTLIEVLVAFAIATAALGLLFRIYANSTATVLLSEEYEVATELAESLVDEHAMTEDGIAFERDGVVAGKYRWRVTGEAYRDRPERGLAEPKSGSESESESEGMRPAYPLRSIDVDVAWQSHDRERDISLRALRPVLPDGAEADH